MGEKIFLWNTATRAKDAFTPITPGLVKLYTCGPTVYHYAHIGNLRTYVFEDLLRRTLEHEGLEVLHVMNITDVGHLVSDGDEGEDKMEKGARKEGKSAWEIADFYTQAFFRDTERLNILRPKIIPKATDYIPQMIAIIEALEKKGMTYLTSDGVYYDTAKFPNYGKLAKLDIENLDAGARVEMREKRRPTDFALWKLTPKGEKRQMEWDSPWGRGFPGWHIECSAMSMAHLGETMDIHCGGKDHIPVHHTNEIAQSEGCTGKTFSRWWMHGEFLTEDKGKISKSAGTVLNLDYLVQQGFEPLAYRFLLLQAHYRTEINFHWDSLASAQAGLSGLWNRISTWTQWREGNVAAEKIAPFRARFRQAMLDDLNSPMAIAVLFEAMKSAELSEREKSVLLEDFDKILGLDLSPEKVMARLQTKNALAGDAETLAAARDAARKAKNWAESDRLRAELEAKGYVVTDTPEGTKVRRK